MPLNIGQLVRERYQILALLGQGGMGAVYRAFDQRDQRPCAIKEMCPAPDLAPDKLAGLRDQFRREASILATLRHTGLTRVSDYFVEGENEYLVMDFVQGKSVEDILKEREYAPLPEPQVLAWAHELLDTLAYIHSYGVIHRDIKPANIRVKVDGHVVLVDFGLFKLWDPRNPATQMALRGAGTPQFAPPEQMDSSFGHTDARSDIYSLGATLYTLLTGHAPPRVNERMFRNVRVPPLRSFVPGLSPHVDKAILKSLALKPAQRFQSASEMLAALDRRSSQPSVTPPLWAWILLGAVVLILLCLLVAVGVLVVMVR